HYWASVLFTRVTVNGMSLLLLLPRNRFTVAAFEHWDFAAVASLARNLCECCLTYFYMCVDDVDDEEWGCRWNIFNLHDCLDRQKLFQLLGSHSQAENFRRIADDLRERLRANSHFASLSERSQKNCLRGRTPYLLT